MSTISPKKLFWLALLIIALAACSGNTPTAISPAANQPSATDSTQAGTSEVSFAKDVLPIFEANCTECHGSTSQKAGLALNTYTALMNGASKGAVIVSKDAAGSKLVKLITNGTMPKKGTPLSSAEIKIISDWINAGALDN